MEKYLVALEIRGLMEDSEVGYCNLQEIEADSEVEAEKLYNERNNCSFFYGKCIGRNGTITPYRMKGKSIKPKYLVALEIGGLMEQPEVEYINLQEIEATSASEAEKLYNERNNCSFFYGKCIGINGIIMPYRIRRLQHGLSTND